MDGFRSALLHRSKDGDQFKEDVVKLCGAIENKDISQFVVNKQGQLYKDI